MDLKNGYKVMYEEIEGSERVFSASKTGLHENAEKIVRYPLNYVKVVYEGTDHKLYGINKDGTRTDLSAINNVLFTEDNTNPEEPVTPVAEEEIPTEPEKPEEPEDITEGEDIPEEGTEEV